MKMKALLLMVSLLCFADLATAQNKLSLQQAVETGIKNNIDVLQSGLQMEKSSIALSQSRARMLPNLNASADHGVNYGRSIDPFTNSFINQKVGFASYGASSSILLFNGLALQNQIRSDKLGYEASRLELQQAKDNLTINIILSYLQVLSAGDVLKLAQQQDTVTRRQVERLDILNQSGAILPSNFYDLKGQLANDEIAIADGRAALETAKLSLSQLLNIPYSKDLEVERIPEQSFSIEYTDAPDKIYQTALSQFAQVKAASLRTQSAEKNIRAIKGQLYPTLSFGGNINTNYSSVATRDYFLNSAEIPSSNYVNVSGTQYPVIVKQNNYDARKISYGDQLSNNLFYTIDLGLSIPLFNAGRVRNQVKLAKIDLKSSELVEKNTQTLLQQSIEQAYVNLTSAIAKYTLLQGQVSSFEQSFQTVEIRFNTGVVTSVDYLIAKNNLDRSRGNLIIAKYDVILREKVLDYYGGKPLW